MTRNINIKKFAIGSAVVFGIGIASIAGAGSATAGPSGPNPTYDQVCFAFGAAFQSGPPSGAAPAVGLRASAKKICKDAINPADYS